MRPLLAAAFLLASCSFGGGPPALKPPPGIIVLEESGTFRIAEATTGQTLARLPGPFVYHLSRGGDVDEAYLIADREVDAVFPAKSYARTKVLSISADPAAVNLVEAPGLTRFVGNRTVLLLAWHDGTITALQHGAPFWADPPGQEILAVKVIDNRVFVAAPDTSWSQLDPTNGKLGDPLGAPPCHPVAVISGSTLLDCDNRFVPGGKRPLFGRDSQLIETGSATYLALSDGSIWRLSAAGGKKSGIGPAWQEPPAPAPDGSGFYVLTPYGIDRVGFDGSHHQVVAQKGLVSIATTRDGNYLYGLGGGKLRTFSAATGVEAASFGSLGTAIYLVAGG